MSCYNTTLPVGGGDLRVGGASFLRQGSRQGKRGSRSLEIA